MRRRRNRRRRRGRRIGRMKKMKGVRMWYWFGFSSSECGWAERQRDFFWRRVTTFFYWRKDLAMKRVCGLERISSKNEGIIRGGSGEGGVGGGSCVRRRRRRRRRRGGRVRKWRVRRKTRNIPIVELRIDWRSKRCRDSLIAPIISYMITKSYRVPIKFRLKSNWSHFDPTKFRLLSDWSHWSPTAFIQRPRKSEFEFGIDLAIALYVGWRDG